MFSNYLFLFIEAALIFIFADDDTLSGWPRSDTHLVSKFDIE